MTTIRRTMEVSKVDVEQQCVWGWAYVCEENGVPVVDHSGQVVAWQEVEKAAHGFVRDSRTGGVMHEAVAGDVVDSMFFSEAIQKALGIDLGKVGWFIGFHVSDADVWKRVKSGELPAFSIAGEADVEAL